MKSVPHYPHGDIYLKMFCKGSLFAVLCMASAVLAEDLPRGWKVCKRSDPKLKACLTEAATVAHKSLIEGNELGLPKLDPHFVREMTFTDSGKGGPVQMKVVIRNYTVEGVGDAIVQDVDFDQQKLIFTAKFLTPQLLIKGKYDISGKIIKLILKGSGDVMIRLHEVSIKIETRLAIIKKSGVKYFQVKNFTFSLTAARSENQLDNLFNGNRQLGDYMNKLINENSVDVYREVGPSIDRAYSRIFAPWIQRIFESFPADVLSPP